MKNLVLHRVLIICPQRLSLRRNHHHYIPEHEKGHNENLTSGSPPIIRCPGRKTQRRQGRRGEELLARCGRCITYISRKDAQTRAHAPRSSIRLKHIPRPGVNFLVLRCLRSPIYEGLGWADVGPRVFITRWIKSLQHNREVSKRLGTSDKCWISLTTFQAWLFGKWDVAPDHVYIFLLYDQQLHFEYFILS